jgi:outer membrane protein TolC
VAEGALAQARSTLADGLGLSAAVALRLPNEPSVPDFGELDEAQLRQLAFAHRPELRAAQAAVRQAQAERALQGAALRNAEPALGPAGMRESGGMRLDGVGLQISLPVFDSGRARAAIAETKVQDAQFRAEAQRRRISLDVALAVERIAITRIGLAQAERALREVERAAELQFRSHQAGNSDATTLLAARSAILDASLRVLAGREALVSDLAGLQWAVASFEFSE